MRLSSRARALALATASLAIAPAALVAQPGGVASACSIDPNNPKELALVSLKFQQARAAQDAGQRRAALVAVGKELDTKPERFAKNPAGYHYIMSQLLGMWLVEPDIGMTPTRGTLGFVSNPTATIDLVSAVDSSFKIIETSAPACASDVAALRQNDAWLALTRRALDASNSNQLDTADYYASRSLRLSSASPYPHYVMANVANVRGDKKAAIAHWQAVVKSAGTDTTYRDIRNSSIYYIGMAQLEQAATLSGAEKAAMAREAASSLAQYLKDNPESPDAPGILSGVADAYTLAGDSAKLADTYADLLAAPDKHSDFTLAMAGVIATRANKVDDAVKLFESAIARNANSRDALRNLAATYHGKDRFKDMFTPAAKLVSIDPNNYDGWMMFAYASQGLMNAAKTPAEKKQWTDSIVKYRTLAEALPVKVEVGNFQRGASNATLTLELEQVAAAAGTYSVTAEFLDASGNVVATATESAGPIAKGAKATVTLKANGSGITAYRYKALK